jgi:glucose-1-phosphate adenylyltransferase
MLSVILGGGAGTRLFPLTKHRSKPAVPLGGKYRLVDVPISNCINSDVIQIFVLTQYNSASLNRHIARTYRFSQFTDGFVEILAAEQTPDSPQWFQGTADAVRQVLPHIDDWGIDTLLILSGDHLYRMDYRDFLDKHDETGADVTISVIPCQRKEAEEFGLLKTDESGSIIEFKEKPKGDALESMHVDTTKLGLSAEQAEERPFLASMGIYVFKFPLLKKLLTENKEWVDFGREVIPVAINSYNVQAFMFDGYWEDIGTIQAFFNANLDMAAQVPKFNFFNAEAPIYSRARYLPPSKMHNCEISDSLISEGCILQGAKVVRSIVGLRSRIETSTSIESSIIMGSDFYQAIEEMREDIKAGVPPVGIGRDTSIRRAIIDKNARIGTNVKLLNESGLENFDAPDGSYYIRERIIIVPKNGIVVNGTAV